MLEILRYPDKRLREKSKRVESFDLSLHTLLDEMYLTMMAKSGVGLAAIQAGVALQVLIVNIPDESGDQKKEDLLEVINPKIVSQSGSIKFNEGCLSVAEYNDDIDRYSDIEVEYQDRYGNECSVSAKDFLAVALQHEIDHLNGILFIDKISIMKRKKYDKELKREAKKRQ